VRFYWFRTHQYHSIRQPKYPHVTGIEEAGAPLDDGGRGDDPRVGHLRDALLVAQLRLVLHQHQEVHDAFSSAAVAPEVGPDRPPPRQPPRTRRRRTCCEHAARNMRRSSTSRPSASVGSVMRRDGLPRWSSPQRGRP
jgi:hypothetical protein